MFKKTNKELTKDVVDICSIMQFHHKWMSEHDRKIDVLTKLTKLLDVENKLYRFKNEKEIEELKKDRDELRDRVEQLEKKLDKLLTNE